MLGKADELEGALDRCYRWQMQVIRGDISMEKVGGKCWGKLLLKENT